MSKAFAKAEMLQVAENTERPDDRIETHRQEINRGVNTATLHCQLLGE